MNRSRMTDFVQGDCDSGHAIPSDRPFYLDDRTLLPCINLRGSMVQSSNGAWAVMLELEGVGSVGLYSQMTPEGARMCGNMLLKMAAEVDALVAQQAAAAIEAARQKGGAA